ncbi:MAG: serine hydrolase [Candidatus Nanohaloarchaea archaeon]
MEEIREFLEWLREEYNIPSISCGIYFEGKKETVVVGKSDTEKNIEANENTRYCIGSCTKSFTALAILKLCEEGKLNLKDSPTEYIEELPSEFDNVQLIHLLSHSSGVPSDSAIEVVVEEEFGLSDYGYNLNSSEGFLNYLNDNTVKSRFKPSETKLYYNSGYTILGMIISRVSDTSYERFIQKELLNYLNIDKGEFNLSSKDEDVATPYRISNSKLEESSYPTGFAFNPAGGLFLNAKDAAEYMSFLTEGRFSETSLLNKSNAEKLTEPQISANPGASIKNDGSYCLGLYKTEFLGKTVYCHGGVAQSSSAGIVFDDEEGVMIMTNSNTPFYPSNIAFAIYSILKGKSPDEVPFFSLNKKLKALEGLYSDEAGVWKFEVEEAHPHLKLSLKSDVEPFEAKLEPDSHEKDNLKFWSRAENGERNPSPIEFNEEDGNKVFYYLGHRFERKNQ